MSPLLCNLAKAESIKLYITQFERLTLGSHSKMEKRTNLEAVVRQIYIESHCISEYRSAERDVVVIVKPYNYQ